MPIEELKKSIFTEHFVYTNYLTATSSNPEAIIRLRNTLYKELFCKELQYRSIKRILILNVDKQIMESIYPYLSDEYTCNTKTYFYNETWATLHGEILCDQNKDNSQPIMLCQFVTTEEITPKHLIHLQGQDIDKLTITNRWHAKLDIREYDARTIYSSWKNAGHLSMTGKNILTNENAYTTKDGLPNFVYEHKIDICVTCPNCSDETSAGDLYFGKVCRSCIDHSATTLEEILNKEHQQNE